MSGTQKINTLVALFAQGRYAEVETMARAQTVRFPKNGIGWKALGTALKLQGRSDEALIPLQKAAVLQGDAETHNNLGLTLQELGRAEEAEASFQRAIRIRPDYADAYRNLGNVLQDLRRFDDSVPNYRRALEIKHDYAEAHLDLGNALKGLGQLDDAIASYRRALKIKPDYAEAHDDLGIALKDLGQLAEAVASYRRALEIKPDYAEAHCNLGNAQRILGQLDNAVASCRRALEIKPNFSVAHNNLGYALQDLGQLDNAVASYRRALEIKHDYAEAHSNLLFCLSHSEAVDEKALFAEHCHFAEQFEAPLRANWKPHTNSRIPGRCLTVGFVSADLCNHPVSYFIEPILAHLVEYPQLSLHAYYNHDYEDVVTHRLRRYLPNWHPIVGLSDEALAQKIRDDGIDILIDLSGHTAKHRLLTFARKPAPVQVSWMGYFGTTGLRGMDYYLTDRYFLPPGQFDNQFSEKIVYLPAFGSFMPPEESPLVNALPALGNGYVTFGSFNRLSKISPSVIALWSQLLRALPESRIALGAIPQDGYGSVIDWFAQEGIVQERVRFYPRCSLVDYLALYHQVDICLDTFPYPGCTSSCHALWMGVPTLTMIGCSPLSRVGGIIPSHVGLVDFIAQGEEDFFNKGLIWARDTEALARIRTESRARLENSAMGQPAVIADGLQRALRIMWQRWCDDRPPVVSDLGG